MGHDWDIYIQVLTGQKTHKVSQNFFLKTEDTLLIIQRENGGGGKFCSHFGSVGDQNGV